MKIFLIAFAILGLALKSNAQLGNMTISDALKFEKIYAGFDTKTILPNDSLYSISVVSMRLGLALNWRLSEKIFIYSHGAIQWSNKYTPYAITAFVLYINLTDKLKLGIGIPPTATTFTRAHPITWKSQTESYSQARIPGNKPGLILQYSVSNKLKAAYSLQNLIGSGWSNHLNITLDKFSIAGYIQEGNEFFVSVRLNTNKMDLNYNYSSIHNEHTSSIFLNLTKKVAIYGDANYFSYSQEMGHNTFGVRRYFENKSYHTAGFLSVSYDIVNSLSSVQLFLYLK
jgi:hypothetical protein